MRSAAASPEGGCWDECWWEISGAVFEALAVIAGSGLHLQLVDEVNDIEETATATFADAGTGDGNGNDFLAGGTQDDILTGGIGADSFLFRRGDGRDLIIDYRGSQGDKIQIDINGIDNFDQLLATAQQQNGGVLFAFGNGDELFLAGTQLAALDRNSFTFY
jgi:hypothetical protein